MLFSDFIVFFKLYVISFKLGEVSSFKLKQATKHI